MTVNDCALLTTNAADLAHRINPALRHLVPVFSDLDSTDDASPTADG